MPTNNGNVGFSASEALRGNPALDSWRTVPRSSDSSAKSSTDLRTTSNCSRCEMGGTLIEVSKTSENPRSVMCCPSDDVASTKRRRPCSANTQDLSAETLDDVLTFGGFRAMSTSSVWRTAFENLLPKYVQSEVDRLISFQVESRWTNLASALSCLRR